MMSDWQPIETAPKDGTWVIVTCACDRVPEITFYGTESWLGTLGHEPTHWMPLPEPPTL